MTYLLFDATDEQAYIKSVKREIDEQFEQINISSTYFIKKSIRKSLRNVRKYIRYSGKKETEVELIIYFCSKMNRFKPSLLKYTPMKNLYDKIIASARKTMLSLHEDLQYDYSMELEQLLNQNSRHFLEDHEP